MRIVGDKNRHEFVLDPIEAIRRGEILEQQMKILLAPHARGVWHGTHEFFNRMDDERSAAMAQRVSESPLAYPTNSDSAFGCNSFSLKALSKMGQSQKTLVIDNQHKTAVSPRGMGDTA